KETEILSLPDVCLKVGNLNHHNDGFHLVHFRQIKLFYH
ncbi:unnamed protein product, partial [Rotaria magnacalcarata]